VRVPLTANSQLWCKGVRVGREVLWLHSFGTRYVDPAAGRPKGAPKLHEDCMPGVVVGIPDTEADMPETIFHDAGTSTLHVGKGQVAPVPRAVWDYQVSGMKIVKKWFSYRKRKPCC
jgi:hypothetical protein